MVDPGTAARLIGIAAVASGDVPEPASEPASEPVSEPASEPASEPVSEPASEPATKSEFTTRVHTLVYNLARNNPVFKDLELRVNKLLTDTGYVESLIANATDDPDVADNVRMALDRLGITDSILEDIPLTRFTTVTAKHANVVEHAKGITPKIIIHKEADSTISFYWMSSPVPIEKKYKEITDRSADDIRTVASALAVNKQDVGMGPLGTMKKFMTDTNVPEDLQPIMETTLDNMGIDAKTLHAMKDNTYITVKSGQRNPSVPVPSSESGLLFLSRFTIYILKTDDTFKRVNTLPESLKSKKPIFVVTEVTPSSVKPPADSKVVSGYILKLFDFLHKQSMTGGTSHHRIPHRPAKKTRRRHRSSSRN